MIILLINDCIMIVAIILEIKLTTILYLCLNLKNNLFLIIKMKKIIRENHKYIFYEDGIYSKTQFKFLVVRDSKRYGKYTLHQYVDDNDCYYSQKRNVAIFKFNI